MLVMAAAIYFLTISAGFTMPEPFDCGFTEQGLTPGTFESVACTAQYQATWDCNQSTSGTVDGTVKAFVWPGGFARGDIRLAPPRPQPDCRLKTLTMSEVRFLSTSGSTGKFIDGQTLQESVFGPTTFEERDGDNSDMADGRGLGSPGISPSQNPVLP